MTEKKHIVSAQTMYMGARAERPHLDESLNYEEYVDGLRKNNVALSKACTLALVRLEGGSLKEQEFNKGIANVLRSVIEQATGEALTTQPKTITIHIEGGLVADITGIPVGYELRVEDYDVQDPGDDSWDALKECAVTVYEGGVA